MQDDIANKKTNIVNEEAEQTIELNNTTHESDEIEKKNREALAMAAAAAAKAKDKAKTASEDPNLFFTITSVAALLVVCVVTYFIISQYFNTWSDTKLPTVTSQHSNHIPGKK